MPLLPTIDIPSQSHFDRIVAAFPGSTNAEKIAAYRAWSINNLISFVQAAEWQTIQGEVEEFGRQKRLALSASLPTPRIFPPAP